MINFNNKYFLMRHGQAVSNVKNIISCWPEKFYNPLTKEGKKQVKESAKKLEFQKIDLIFASDVLRTKMTAEAVGKNLKIKPEFDKRLREQNSGIFNNQPLDKISVFFGEMSVKRFKLKPKNGETYIDIQKRVLNFLKDIDKKYKGKNILIISHELPLILLEAKARGVLSKNFYKERIRFSTAEFNKIN
jgi:broad specificity phosphatase PhoE